MIQGKKHSFIRPSSTLRKKALEKIVRERENAGDQYFLPFPQCFVIVQKKKKNVEFFSSNLSSANALNIDK